MSTSDTIPVNLLSNPDRLATALSVFSKARDAALKAQRGFADLESKAAALAKERAACARLAAGRAALEADIAAHELVTGRPGQA
jgi:hypothetical protein